jgi:diamine N-acetyltransferase
MSAKPTSSSARSNSLAGREPVTVRALDWTDWVACLLLRVRPDQRDFVASNFSSLIEAWTDDWAHPFAICQGDKMVGFSLVAFERQDKVWWICRLMIDKKWQGQGYGRAAMIQIINRLKQVPGCDRVLIGHHPDNLRAQKLYLSLGFQRTGRRLGIEEILALQITPQTL